MLLLLPFRMIRVLCSVYRCIVRDLPPTPSKFHYIFNLRDLSRIYSGMCLTVPDRFEKVEQFVRVWRHECMRVIFDRLISVDDGVIVHVRHYLSTTWLFIN